MNNIFSDNPTWTVGIIFGLLGLIITYRLYLQRDKHNRISEASQKLVAIFNTELANIYPLPVNWPVDIDSFLRLKFPILQAAINEFSRLLNDKERENLDDIWVKFYKDHGDSRCQSYHHYIGFGSNPNYKENLKNNVDAILNFAKQKQT